MLSRDVVNFFTFMQPYTIHLQSVSSTNDYAKELLTQHPYVVVSAEHQTSGRGRNGKVWHGDEHKNVYCSFGIRHSVPPTHNELPLYMARGALAVLETIRALIPTAQLRLKYPNDVHALEGNRWSKISGVLVEHEFLGSTCTTTIIGVGINVEQTVFPETIDQPCTSVCRIANGVEVEHVLHVLRNMIAITLDLSPSELSSQWVTELAPSTTRFRINGEDGLWRIRNLGDDGRLHAEHILTRTERIISDGDTLRYED